MRSLSILGSTGSVGTQTLQVAQHIGAEICALTTNKNIKLLEEQARQFKPKMVAAFDENSADLLKIALADTDIKVYSGIDGLTCAAVLPECDMVVTALVGMVGLLPTLSAIKAGKDIALANKETLVCAGQVIMQELKGSKGTVFPVDSEHSALFQCLLGQDRDAVKNIVLTASGGPFYNKLIDDIYYANKQQALRHPNWNMGSKITIDSASMMNKGLEVIEAMWLYDMPIEKIDVLIHRESIIHSMVEYEDNAVIAQLGVTDMRIPIQYAITYPKRVESACKKLKLWEIGRLSFDKPDLKTFKCLSLAIDAARVKGNMGAILNGANERAVELFLQDKIAFGQIAELVEMAMDKVEFLKDIDLKVIFESDRMAREVVSNNYK